MASNSIAPAYFKVHYLANGHGHTATYPTVIVGTPTPGEDAELLPHSGGTVLFSVAALALANAMKGYYKTTDTFELAELWSKPSEDSDPLFIYAVTLGVAGTGTTTHVTGLQNTMTFKTAHKGNLKLVMVEPLGAADERDVPPFTPDGISDVLSTYIIGDTCPIYARNGDKPLLVLGQVSKLNDVLRRKYLTG